MGNAAKPFRNERTYFYRSNFEAWETENCCHGYIKNTPDDIKGNRVFAAFEGSAITGYLFGHEEVAEKEIADHVDMIMLGTATKNFRAILHFYIDELGMKFWSARLFKSIKK